MEKQQRDQVDRNIKEAKERLEAEMESAKHEHQLMLMRQGRDMSGALCVFSFKLVLYYQPSNSVIYFLTENSNHDKD